MNYKSGHQTIGAEVAIYTAFFEALSGNSILVQTDKPNFTILATTPGYITSSGRTKKSLIGKGIFEAFPANSTDPNHLGDTDLLASFMYVLQHKKAHYLPLQHYNLQNDGGSFAEKFWRVENKPVLSASGEVNYIIYTAEDITEKIIAERRKVQIEGIEKVFGLFMDAPMVVSLVNGDDYVLEMANKEAFKIWGKGKEIIGQPLLQVLPGLKDQGIIKLFDEVRQTGQVYVAHEVPVVSFIDGKENQHYFNLFYQPYFGNSSSKVSGVFTIWHNVTEQVQARKKAEESEAKFRTMAESTPVLIAVGDETGTVTYFNKAWTTLTGMPMQELLHIGWANLIHPEEREEFIEVFQEAFDKKDWFSREFRILDAGGGARWLLAHGAPRFDGDGNFMGYIGACTDITEHKKIQEQLQTALEQIRLSKEAAELGTFDLDLVNGLLHWDDRCRTLFGISHQDKVTYEKDFVQGLHPDDRERILKVIDRVFVQSVSNGDYDVEYRTVGAEDGAIRWIRAKGKVYFNDAEEPIRFIGSVLDITEQVTAIQKIETLVADRTKELAAANETLQNINTELKRSNQNLEEFAHAASHDLKEPVRKIQFFTNQLKEQLSNQLSESQTRALNRIENATERMGNLIDDLLVYSHVSHRPVEMEDVDLNKKLQKVLEDLELDIQEKKATINVEVLPTVKGYRRQLQQLFQNLISNALKYSKKNVPPQINIASTLVLYKDKSYYQITVKDNGIGFEQIYADKIFQMFSRLHGKTEYSGTGVGLSIVKKVVQNHNGFITVQSQPEAGTTFKVLLPA